jgi:glycosyltransferase involved in cell wall biosynthesis
MKTVYVSVINDLSHDQRVHKVCTVLHNSGFKVTLVGRKLPDSKPINRDYSIKRMRLVFKKGALFYAFFNIRLFFLLLFRKTDILHANDLDTLLANYLVSRIKRIPLIYDSHEYFTGVPEIQHRKVVKSIWTSIEKWIFPKLKYVFTVNESIAELYRKQYKGTVNVMRNIPLLEPVQKLKSKEDLKLPLDKKIIILQGAGINIDRGAEELIEAIALMNDVFLIIAGSGDVIQQLKNRSLKSDLEGKVLFTGKLPYHEMMQFTMNADVGVTLDKSTNINYELSLPNKLFDYIKASIPVLSSDLVEIKKVINEYQIGTIISDHHPLTIKNSLESLINNEEQRKLYIENTIIASKQLSWENEVIELVKVYEKLK